jgi:hypothetical protein
MKKQRNPDLKTLPKLQAKNKTFNKEFFVFDTETTPFELNDTVSFRFGVVYGWNYVKVLYSIEEFHTEFLQEKYRNKKVFAHNAEFDLNVLYGNIYELDKKAVFNGKFISATNGNCFFCDSMNIFRTSVKKIGELLELHKLDTNVVLENTGDTISEAEIKYCIRDCEIVYNALLYIFEKSGSLKITSPGLSLDFFRRKFQLFNIDYNFELSNYFLNSYFGGRTEAFKIGKTEAVVFDANSMYPFAMLNAVFPNPKYLREVSNLSVSLFTNKYLNNYEGCAKIKVNHKPHFVGFLPIKLNNKLLFPVGVFEGIWNFNEIRYALECEIIEIMEVYTVVFAERLVTPFAGYVSELYNERKEAKGLEKETLKLFLNSLYGKFAQQIKSEFIYIKNQFDPEQFKLIESYEIKGELIKIKPFNSERSDLFIEIKSNRGEHLYNSIPVFSSYITSYARVHLLKSIIKYIDYKPVYCDTDSIFFEIEPPINDSSELGEWKKENKIVTEIRGLKNYSYISENLTKDKIKGVPGKATKIDNKNFEYNSLIKTKEALVRNIKPNTYVKRKKTLTGKYDKRQVFENGETLPITLP